MRRIKSFSTRVYSVGAKGMLRRGALDVVQHRVRRRDSGLSREKNDHLIDREGCRMSCCSARMPRGVLAAGLCYIQIFFSSSIICYGSFEGFHLHGPSAILCCQCSIGQGGMGAVGRGAWLCNDKCSIGMIR